MDNQPKDKKITLSSAAQIIPRCPKTIANWINSGKWEQLGYKAWRINGTLFVSQQDCEDYMRRCRV